MMVIRTHRFFLASVFALIAVWSGALCASGDDNAATDVMNPEALQSKVASVVDEEYVPLIHGVVDSIWSRMFRILGAAYFGDILAGKVTPASVSKAWAARDGWFFARAIPALAIMSYEGVQLLGETAVLIWLKDARDKRYRELMRTVNSEEFAEKLKEEMEKREKEGEKADKPAAPASAQ